MLVRRGFAILCTALALGAAACSQDVPAEDAAGTPQESNDQTPETPALDVPGVIATDSTANVHADQGVQGGAGSVQVAPGDTARPAQGH